MSWVTLLWTWQLREWREIRRYPFGVLVQAVSGYVMFLLIFLVARAFGGGSVGAGIGSEASFVVGFMVVAFVVGAFRRVTFAMMTDLAHGTLEQLALSPFGLAQNIVARGAAYVVVGAVVTAALLAAMIATTQVALHLDFVSIAPLLLLTSLSAYGIAYVLAGLALVFKRVQEGYQLLNWLLVAVAMIPFSERVAAVLPVAAGARLLRRVMVEGTRVRDLPVDDVAVLALNSVGYLAVGVLTLVAGERITRRRGTLGHR